jgi:ankyrin repeat protein
MPVKQAAAQIGDTLLDSIQPHQIGTMKLPMWLPKYDNSWAHIRRSIVKNGDGIVGSSLILALAHSGAELPVKLLLEKGANIEAISQFFHRSPLILAARRGYDAVVRLLLQEGANIEAADRWGQTALILAARLGHLEVVRLLIEKGANIHAITEYKRTALHLAAKGGFNEVVRLLVEEGVDVTVKDQSGKIAFDESEGYPVIREFLKAAESRR